MLTSIRYRALHASLREEMVVISRFQFRQRGQDRGDVGCQLHHHCRVPRLGGGEGGDTEKSQRRNEDRRSYDLTSPVQIVGTGALNSLGDRFLTEDEKGTLSGCGAVKHAHEGIELLAAGGNAQH
jgi:hypothetical protein